jgi:hypothetical protein
MDEQNTVLPALTLESPALQLKQTVGREGGQPHKHTHPHPLGLDMGITGPSPLEPVHRQTHGSWVLVCKRIIGAAEGNYLGHYCIILPCRYGVVYQVLAKKQEQFSKMVKYSFPLKEAAIHSYKTYRVTRIQSMINIDCAGVSARLPPLFLCSTVALQIIQSVEQLVRLTDHIKAIDHISKILFLYFSFKS